MAESSSGPGPCPALFLKLGSRMLTWIPCPKEGFGHWRLCDLNSFMKTGQFHNSPYKQKLETHEVFWGECVWGPRVLIWSIQEQVWPGDQGNQRGQILEEKTVGRGGTAPCHQHPR